MFPYTLLLRVWLLVEDTGYLPLANQERSMLIAVQLWVLSEQLLRRLLVRSFQTTTILTELKLLQEKTQLNINQILSAEKQQVKINLSSLWRRWLKSKQFLRNMFKTIEELLLSKMNYQEYSTLKLFQAKKPRSQASLMSQEIATL